jgi:hypothetical protein
MVPAPSALLLLWTLKVLDQERRSPLSDFNFAEALGLFAGLKLLPKKSFAADAAYRPGRDQQQALLQGGVSTLAPVMFPDASGFAFDFSLIPDRGEPAGLDRPYRPGRGVAGPSVRTCFAWEPKSRCLCSSHADRTRAAQNGAGMRLVAFGHPVTGTDPQGLYFDSKLIDSPEMSRVNPRKIGFVTLRRRGAAILRRRARRPASDGRPAVIDTPKRCPHQIRYRDATVQLGAATQGRSANSPCQAWGVTIRRCSCPTTSRRPPAR